MLEVLGAIAAICGAIVVIYGTYTAIGWLSWHASWNWGDANKLVRSIRLGWNIGEPPEGVWFVCREHCHELAIAARLPSREHRWGLMKRIGNTCHSINGGYLCPATNITGWLEVAGDDLPKTDNDR